MISPRRVNGNDFDNEFARELDYDLITLQHQLVISDRLLVIQRSTTADEIRAYNKSSSLWAKNEKFSLKTNMRVHLHNDVDLGHYAETLLNIGDGCLDADTEDYIFYFPHSFVI
ncbi:ATP-dependent DNA helicase [Trichonephila clavipes]|nr:ATP-dependent DNA helicase [Trichonephila clavipes]